MEVKELQQMTKRELESLMNMIPTDVDPNKPLSEEVKSKMKDRTLEILELVKNT